MKSETNTSKSAKSETKAKTARVKVLKIITYGNRKCAPGHEIKDMDIDEVKLRADAGEVRLIKFN